MTPKLTRADKAFCRRWTRAYRKGMATKEITGDWLRALRGPENKKLMKARGRWSDDWSTVQTSGITSTQVYQDIFMGYPFYQRGTLRDAIEAIDE